MKSTELELPGIRYYLIHEIKLLSDPEIQKEWSDSNFENAFWDNFCMYINTLIDGMPYEDNPPKAIGIVLRNYEELVYVQFLIQCLMSVIKIIGINQPDSAYLNSPLWDDVVEAAKQAYAVLMKDEDLEALAEAERNRVIPSNDNHD